MACIIFDEQLLLPEDKENKLGYMLRSYCQEHMLRKMFENIRRGVRVKVEEY